jgi:hypothetical protein
VLGLFAVPAQSQLISPGKLTSVHARFEGISNCTSCHVLGQRGVAPQKCLDCHTPLRARIRRDEGFHASVDTDCGTCHKEHFGRDFDMVRLDTDSFDHDDTGYPLLGEHAEAECRDCHQPDFITAADVRTFKLPAGQLEETYLGIADDCATCHRRDSPHGRDFRDADCASCHDPRGWDQTSDFDHTSTGFALVGQHAALACTSCHGEGTSGTIQFTNVEPECATCHRTESPHGTQFQRRDCADCHDSRTWEAAPNFNHARSDFPLTGAHLRVACHDCHQAVNGRTQFANVAHETCQSCHDDAHDGELGADCATCHTTTAWERMGRSFDDTRFNHAATTGFALIGAHAEIGCASCHATPTRDDEGIHITFADNPRGQSFPAIVAEDCQSCHKDYHDDAFANLPDGALCSSCHGQEDWLPVTFGIERHNEETAFPLTGAHLATPCFACHGGTDGDEPHFEFASTSCETCHAELNPHEGQFANDVGVTVCGNCHSTTEWDLASFDHSTTGFALTGRHAALDCASCHTPTTVDGRTVHAFAGLDADCASCHAKDDPHHGQFPVTSCATCHDTEAFTIAAFDHAQTRFPLAGAHESVACGSCHRTETAPDGSTFVRFKPLGTDCADCHGGAE